MTEARKMSLTVKALNANGKKTFSSAHQITILREIGKDLALEPSDIETLVDEMTPFLNASAIVQQLRKAGIVEHELSAKDIAMRDAMLAQLTA